MAHMMHDAVKLNRKIYNATAPLYEERHGEIFNPTEQGRIADSLRSCLASLVTGAVAPRVLDFGAGTGNLTRQLLSLGATVVAADVSEGCLRELRTSTGRQHCLETTVLNGRDLAWADSASFDLVATYSVLHHVPDYLAAVGEFVRVVKPGGIIYIDHEVCPSYWEDEPEYSAYSRELAELQEVKPPPVLPRLPKLFARKGLWRYLLAAVWLKRNRIADEGDIHVHKHDHIEWAAIREILAPHCQILQERDYLVCRERQQPAPVWERWRDRCADMRLIIARKN
ncbi:methyltransferase family protein [Geobacter argillaceus]|uniref:Methyltransferase family protein n=2 Tax=Geobacter argillaceus TaxID=345631 RepID=A0A562VN88_9BACT|nr:methyltransferase family protein [Geobacter argillaceus]